MLALQTGPALAIQARNAATTTQGRAASQLLEPPHHHLTSNPLPALPLRADLARSMELRAELRLLVEHLRAPGHVPELPDLVAALDVGGGYEEWLGLPTCR